MSGEFDSASPTMEADFSPGQPLVDVFQYSDTNFVAAVAHLLPSVEIKACLRNCSMLTLSPPPMTIDEAATIVLYTMESSNNEESFHNLFDGALRDLNRTFRAALFLPYLRLFLRALSHCPRVPPSQQVYRVVPRDLFDVYAPLCGEAICWRSAALLSASLDALGCGPQLPRTVFVIHTAHAVLITELSLHGDVGDVCLLPDVCFRVVNVRRVEAACVVTLQDELTCLWYDEVGL